MIERVENLENVQVWGRFLVLCALRNNLKEGVLPDRNSEINNL